MLNLCWSPSLLISFHVGSNSRFLPDWVIGGPSRPYWLLDDPLFNHVTGFFFYYQRRVSEADRTANENQRRRGSVSGRPNERLANDLTKRLTSRPSALMAANG